MKKIAMKKQGFEIFFESFKYKNRRALPMMKGIKQKFFRQSFAKCQQNQSFYPANIFIIYEIMEIITLIFFTPSPWTESKNLDPLRGNDRHFMNYACNLGPAPDKKHICQTRFRQQWINVTSWFIAVNHY
ncbi:MAG: hypothetical protein MUE70_03815 [Desulfobacterales bacterium]|nr:hypothetical protein [Desulfobacterales bacterium]